ncbi:MAG: hypothetical protein ACJAYB_000092 [Psychromonas sp.]|jgi:hypothetical protein
MNKIDQTGFTVLYTQEQIDTLVNFAVMSVFMPICPKILAIQMARSWSSELSVQLDMLSIVEYAVNIGKLNKISFKCNTGLSVRHMIVLPGFHIVD